MPCDPEASSLRFAFIQRWPFSDWMNGDAHHLRGITAELRQRGHQVSVFESTPHLRLRPVSRQRGEWSPSNRASDLERALADIDVVLVHSWNDPKLVHAIGELRDGAQYLSLLHDTGHGLPGGSQWRARLDAAIHDGVLVRDSSSAAAYRDLGAREVCLWPEAADTAVYRPCRSEVAAGDVAFLGDWGEIERAFEISEYLIEPVRELGAQACVYGRAWSRRAQDLLARAGITQAAALMSPDVASTLGKYRAVVYIPANTDCGGGAGTTMLDVLACGVPLVSAPLMMHDPLLTPGEDFLIVHSGREMRDTLDELIHDAARAMMLALHGYHTVLARHTSRHRVDALLALVAALRGRTQDHPLSLTHAGAVAG